MISYKVVILSGAKQDISEAIAYYEGLQKGLGKKFSQQLNLPISVLRRTPLFQIRYKEIRLLQISKFPFLIHFYVNQLRNEVVILCRNFNP